MVFACPFWSLGIFWFFGFGSLPSLPALLVWHSPPLILRYSMDVSCFEALRRAVYTVSASTVSRPVVSGSQKAANGSACYCGQQCHLCRGRHALLPDDVRACIAVTLTQTAASTVTERGETQTYRVTAFSLRSWPPMAPTAAAALELELLVLLARGWAERGLEWAGDLSARILAVGANIAAQDTDTAAPCVPLEDILHAATKTGWPIKDVSLEPREGLPEARSLSVRNMAAEGWLD